jgi:hypothetical protein
MDNAPALPVMPADRDHRLLRAGTWAGLVAATGFGILTDAAVRAPSGLALTLGTWLAAAAVLVLVRPRLVVAPFVLAACAIGACFAVRASFVLTGLNLVAATALLCAGVSFAAFGEPTTATTRSYLGRVLWMPLEALPEGAASLAGPPARLIHTKRGTAGSVARGLLLVVPVAVALLALLASGDAAFARYIRTPIGLPPGSIVSHALVLGLGATALATLLAVATLAPSALDTAAQRPARAGWARPGEWIALLVVVDGIFAAFVAVQFAVFFGGRARVLAVDGLTYAAYARSGFWQLLGATAIAGGVVAFAWAALPRPASRRHRAVFLTLALILIALVLVVLVSASQRLTLYEDAYGFTWLRVLVHATILGIGALSLCTSVALVARRAAWLPFAAVVIATGVVLGLNVVNLDAFIATHNIARAARAAPLDASVLALLSADAVPAMIAERASLPPDARGELEQTLSCARDELEAEAVGGWAGANRARAIALDSLRTLPLPRCGAKRP